MKIQLHFFKSSGITKFMLIIFLYIIVLIAALFPSASTLQAPFRLTIAFVAFILLPGYHIVRAFRWFNDVNLVREKLPIIFGIGYAFITVVCIVTVFLHLAIWHSLIIIAVFSICLAALSGPEQEPGESMLFCGWLFFPILLLMVCAWVLEPSIQGEETVELITVRKMVEGPYISLDSIMPEPKVIPTYIITPYYFFVALLTKAAGVNLFVTYLKMHSYYVALSLLTFSALAGRLFPILGKQFPNLVVPAFSLLFILDPEPWSWPASMFPSVRRGGISAGVLAPIFILATLINILSTREQKKSFVEWLAPALLVLSLLTTHSTEILYCIFFITAVVLCLCIGTQPAKRLKVFIFILPCISTVFVYKIVHHMVVTHVYAFDLAAKNRALATLRSELAVGLHSLLGISEAGQYLIVASGSVLPLVILGLLISPWHIIARPQSGSIVWAAILIPLILYSSSKLYILLQLATSTEILFIFSYFSLFGLLSFFAGCYMCCATAYRFFESRQAVEFFTRNNVLFLFIFVIIFVLVSLCVLKLLTNLIFSVPLILPWAVGIFGCSALLLLKNHTKAVRLYKCNSIFFLIYVAIVGLVYRGSGEINAAARTLLTSQLKQALSKPSVLDWTAYYNVLQQTVAPKIDLPLHLVDDLTRILPPRQIMIADPVHSFSLPVVLNQYIVNPGHVVSTSLHYFEKFVTTEPDGQLVHPIFNKYSELSNMELTFLHEYGVQYVLVNPKYQDVVGRKFSSRHDIFHKVFSSNGFTLYKLQLDD